MARSPRLAPARVLLLLLVAVGLAPAPLASAGLEDAHPCAASVVSLLPFRVNPPQDEAISFTAEPTEHEIEPGPAGTLVCDSRSTPAIVGNTTFADEMTPGVDEEDWFGFRAFCTENVTIDLAPDPGLDVDLTLARPDAPHVALAFADAGGAGAAEQVAANALPASGDWRIGVGLVAGEPGRVLPYEVSIGVSRPPGDAGTGADASATTPLLLDLVLPQGGGPGAERCATGAFDTSADVDKFAFAHPGLVGDPGQPLVPARANLTVTPGFAGALRVTIERADGTLAANRAFVDDARTFHGLGASVAGNVTVTLERESGAPQSRASLHGLLYRCEPYCR